MYNVDLLHCGLVAEIWHHDANNSYTNPNKYKHT
jgi:hypothetical protein